MARRPTFSSALWFGTIAWCVALALVPWWIGVPLLLAMAAVLPLLEHRLAPEQRNDPREDAPAKRALQREQSARQAPAQAMPQQPAMLGCQPVFQQQEHRSQRQQQRKIDPPWRQRQHNAPHDRAEPQHPRKRWAPSHGSALPCARKNDQPHHTRALRNMRIHGESSPQLSGCQLICTLRNTRSGCGIRIVTRPSAAVKPARPPGEPFGFSG